MMSTEDREKLNEIIKDIEFLASQKESEFTEPVKNAFSQAAINVLWLLERYEGQVEENKTYKTHIDVLMEQSGVI